MAVSVYCVTGVRSRVTRRPVPLRLNRQNYVEQFYFQWLTLPPTCRYLTGTQLLKSTSHFTVQLPEPVPVSDDALAPLENLLVPSELDGDVGHRTNRALGTRPQIAVQNDVDAIKAWLARFVDTKATFDTYRKECERLLWPTTELRNPLSSHTHKDLFVYRRFLSYLQPAQRWVLTGRKVARTAPFRRLLAEPLSPSSQRQAFVRLCQVDGESAVERSDEENEIALSRSPLRCCGHQLRGSLVFPVQPEPARHRRVVARAWCRGHVRNDPLLVRME